MCGEVRPSSKRPLSSVREGESVKIIEIMGGRNLIRRLSEMGFLEGTEVKVVVNCGGPVIIRRGGARTAIGKGMARKILVN